MAGLNATARVVDFLVQGLRCGLGQSSLRGVERLFGAVFEMTAF